LGITLEPARAKVLAAIAITFAAVDRAVWLRFEWELGDVGTTLGTLEAKSSNVNDLTRRAEALLIEGHSGYIVIPQ
jgi:hypothetical protein